MERETYPKEFSNRGIRWRYFGIRNEMISAMNIIDRNINLGIINDFPDEELARLKKILSFDAVDRIFMSCVFDKQEIEQNAFAQLRSIMNNAPATMEGLAKLEKLIEETDFKIRCKVPDWILEILKKSKQEKVD